MGLNKVFKVIWSITKQCYIVVSEFGKAQGGKKKAAVLASAVVLFGGLGITTVALAQGAQSYEAGSATNKASGKAVAIGYSATAGTSQRPTTQNGNIGMIAIGFGANAQGYVSTALGMNAETKGVASIAIGGGVDNGAKATGGYSLAISENTKALGNRSIAIARQSSATQDYATAIGHSSTASAKHAIAFGTGALANITDGIAIGNYSITTATSGVEGFNFSKGRKNTYTNLTNETLTATNAGVSIGSSTKVRSYDGNNITEKNGIITRQINNLAAGSADTDAVNVAQLKSVNLKIAGNTSNSDVLLSSQTLSVLGKTGDAHQYVETTASDNNITVDLTQYARNIIDTAANQSLSNINDAGKTVITNLTNIVTSGDNVKVISQQINPQTKQKTYTISAQNQREQVTATGNDNLAYVSVTNGKKGDANAIYNVTVSKDNVRSQALDAVQVARDPDNNENPVTLSVDSYVAKNSSRKTYKIGFNSDNAAKQIKLSYKAGADTVAKTTALSTGLTFANGTYTKASSANDGKITIDLNDTTANKINNALDKDLTNLSTAANGKITNIAKTAAQDSVKVANGTNTTVSSSAANNVTTYKVNVSGELSSISSITNGTNSGTITFNANNGGITTSNGNLTVGGTKAVVVNSASGHVTGLQNTGWTVGGNTIEANRAATEDQLKIVSDYAKGAKEKADSAASEAAKANQGVSTLTTELTKTNSSLTTLTNTANELGNTKISLSANNNTKTTEKTLSSKNINFGIKGEGSVETSASGNDVTVKLTQTAESNIAKIPTIETTANNAKSTADNAATDIRTIQGNITTINNDIKNIKSTADGAANKDLSNLDATGKKVLAGLGANVVGSGDITVESTTDNTSGKTTHTISTKAISYKANSQGGKSTTASTGFNFKNGVSTVASIGDNGEVSFDLNADTKGKIAKIDTLETKVGENSGKIQTLETKVDEHSKAITEIKTDVGKHS